MPPLRNMPAEVIDRIQILTDGPIRVYLPDLMTATDPKPSTSLQNLNLGTALSAGHGPVMERTTDGKPVLPSIFKDKRRITLLGNLNNINEQNFSSEDLAGVLVAVRAAIEAVDQEEVDLEEEAVARVDEVGGSGDQFLVDQRTGIVTTRAFGLNYSDKWGNAEVSGSYFSTTATILQKTT